MVDGLFPLSQDVHMPSVPKPANKLVSMATENEFCYSTLSNREITLT